jgi:hypothetical protein
MVARLRDAFGSHLPWFAPLASHPFAESDAAPWEQRTAETVMSFLTGQGVEVSVAEVERICRACALPLSQVVELAPGAREAVRAIRDLACGWLSAPTRCGATTRTCDVTGKSSALATASMAMLARTTLATARPIRLSSSARWRRLEPIRRGRRSLATALNATSSAPGQLGCARSGCDRRTSASQPILRPMPRSLAGPRCHRSSRPGCSRPRGGRSLVTPARAAASNLDCLSDGLGPTGWLGGRNGVGVSDSCGNVLEASEDIAR